MYAKLTAGPEHLFILLQTAVNSKRNHGELGALPPETEANGSM